MLKLKLYNRCEEIVELYVAMLIVDFYGVIFDKKKYITGGKSFVDC